MAPVTYLRTIVMVLAASAGVAHAQAKLVETDKPKAAEDKDIQGWNPYLGLTSTFNLVDNKSVIGQVEGLSTLFGLGLLGGADYVHDRHLLRTTITANEGFARTPVVDRFVKTADTVKLEGLYNYFLTDELGGYARASIATSILPTTDVRGTPTTWVDTTGMTPVTLNSNALSQHLANAFEPLTVSESVGGFADPYRKDAFHLSFRLGLGGRHTLADGVLVNHDDAATPEVEVLRLSDVHQVGGEAFAGATGKLDDGKANYRVGLAILLPFVNNDKYTRTALSLTRVAFEGTVTYTMSSWLSVVYSLAVTKDPQLFPEGKELTQIQNTLLLTFQLSLVKKKEKPKAKTKEELELDDAKKRADDAEKRANDAEEQLRRMQGTPPPPAPAPDAVGPPAPTTP